MLLEECQAFVAKIDTMIPLSENHELNLLRKISNILEEINEWELETCDFKEDEEKRDVQFYMLSLLSYLEIKFPHFKERSTILKNPLKSYQEYLGLMKKNLRQYGYISIDECEFRLYAKLIYDLKEGVFFKLQPDFIEKLTGKLLKKFPENSKAWGLN